MNTTLQEVRERPQANRILLACGAIGPLFFIVSFLIEGAIRSGYSALRQPVSSLSIGEMGWMQIANFLISGTLILAFGFGLRQAVQGSRSPSFWGPLLVGLAGVGLIGAGIFVTDPMAGYPAGTPLVPTLRSLHGRLHDLFGLPVFLGLPAACFVFTRRFLRAGERGWALYSLLSGLGMFAFFVLAGLGFRQTPGFAEIAGVFQRLSILTGLGWIALLAIHFMSQKPAGGR